MIKYKITYIILFLLLLSSCSFETKKDKEILELKKSIAEQKLEIEKLKKKEEIMAKIENFRAVKRKIVENKLKEDIEKLKSEKTIKNIDNQHLKISIPEEEILNIKFYSQFPLDIATGIKYDEPYQNFCEEASFLNGYYYLIGEQPNLEEYNRDLLKIKELEDLVLDGGYKHTSVEDTLKMIIAFQGDNQRVFGEIIESPTIDLIKENISKGNPIIIPVYGKGLSNHLFNNGGPIYHNLLIKGYTEEIFIVNEVGVSKGDGYKYKQSELMKSIHNFDKNLYPNNFTEGKKEILILYK